jgi:hypothetical protein
MTYNLKTSYKNVKFAYANRSTDVSLSAATFYNYSQYPLTSLSGSTGLQATLSAGDIVLGDRVYHGFFYPQISTLGKIIVSVFINGTALVSQRTAIKEIDNTPISTGNITRAQPLFFTYIATAGDVLSIKYYKVPGDTGTILSETSGTNLFLMEVEK